MNKKNMKRILSLPVSFLNAFGEAIYQSNTYMKMR